MTTQADDRADATARTDDWLRGLVSAGGLGESAGRLVDHLSVHVAEASYAKASDIAAAVGVSVSSVTRMAQQLGFRGWPDLQRELRARYLARLSLVDLTDIHGATDSPLLASLRQDARALASTVGDVDAQAAARIANEIRRARDVYVVAFGSFAAVGMSLVHNLQLVGYRAHVLLDGPNSVSNTLGLVGPGDLLIGCTYWRHCRALTTAATVAKRRGAMVAAIADHLPQSLRAVVDVAVTIPAEGSSFFASLTVPMAVQQAIVATVAQLDPERTRANLEQAEALWREFELMEEPDGAT